MEIVRQCMEEIHTTAGGDVNCKMIIQKSDTFFTQCKQRIAELQSLALLDGMAVSYTHLSFLTASCYCS